MPRKPNYDKSPFVSVIGYESDYWQGWDAIGHRLLEAIKRLGKDKTIVAVEAYSGVHDTSIAHALQDALQPDACLAAQEVFKSPEKVDALVAPDLCGNDPVFGCYTRLTLNDFLDSEKREAMASQPCQ